MLNIAWASTEEQRQAKPQLTEHKGLSAHQWYKRYKQEHRALTKHGKMVRAVQGQLHDVHTELVRLQRMPTFATAGYSIKLAASVFGVSASDMWSVARCETGGTFSPFSRNTRSTASGLFQFLDSTWASQGIDGFSVFDPVANALGAARIVARQGWRQWSCQP